LKKLAVKRHYYGFLAASQLKQPYQLNHQSIEQTAQEKQHLLENPAAKRAFEWFHLKRYREARSEWNYWTKTLNDRAKLIAAQLAYEAKWYDRPIFTLANVGFLEDTELRFPLAFESLIKQQAQQAQIDPAWAFAIARRESSFMVDATSPAGARGLMQIMPATARHILRKHISRRYLFDAKYNVALGTQYLRYLYKKMNNNWLLATASYNAGPNKVKQWLPDTAIDADRWIELIPYQETRDYVKSVLAYQQIYRHKLNNTNNVFDQVIKMKIHRE
jgi:soluble lytic murein transglycosylase